MLNAEQISSIAASLNEKINIPMMSEGSEQSMLEQAVGLINDQLAVITDDLPQSAQDLLSQLPDGISAAEAEELKATLVPALNEKVDIPFLGEGQESDMLIKPAVDMIVSTLGSIAG